VSTKLQLILVEDNPPDAEIVARHLARAKLHFSIHRVETEAELLTALTTHRPDLIISDFSLPQFDGLRALEVAAAHSPHTPFIFVSGTIGEERAIEALRRGATDYVLKTNLARLGPAVERALREAALRAKGREAEAQRREQELRLQRLTRSYRMLSSTGSAILRLHNRAELLDELCRIAVKQGGYDRVAISLVDANAKTLIPHACAGMDSPALRSADMSSLDAPPDGSNISAGAVHAGAPQIINDLAGGESLSGEQRRLWLAEGWRAAAALPLLIDGTAIGSMTLVSGQRGAFDEAELGVLLELAANLCFALQYLDKDEALQFLSYFDGLTGLAKRHLFCQRLAKLVSGASVERSLGVMVFDVQKLGTFNDSLGRYVGDRLIAEIAARVKQAFVNSESAAHFGGGTFALVLSDLECGIEGDAAQVLQRSAGPLFLEPFLIGGQELRPTIRAGLAFYPHDGNAADALVQNAEAALKAAREDNEKCLIYSMVTQRPTSRSVAMETRLTAALERQEYLLHYQPKVDIATGAIVGLEALLRWKDVQEGLVSPAIFVPLLERSGAIVEVGRWVIQQAVHDCQAWMARGAAPVRVAVNVSPLQLRRRDFVQAVLSSVSPLAGAAGGIDIEITESMLMQDIELSIRKLEELRAAGIGVAIDDFGTGYSSLRLLSRLPVDTLKIDRSFIQGITHGPHAMTLVSTVISLARAFDMRLVAEGVETVEQLDLLRVMGCDQAQGFYLGRPIPSADVPAVIERLSPRRASSPEAPASKTAKRS
jgi:diguanylate cyclase (GGDEF)-like protein